MEQDRQGEPQLCINNCGFFGSPTTNNLCSKCYRDKFLDKSKALLFSEEASPLPPPPTHEKDAGNSHLPAASVPSSSGSSALPTATEPKNRCCFCKKRVGLTGFKCRCGDVFCPAHRHAEDHGCTFDYKTSEKEALAKANPVVKANKVDKI